MENKQEKEIKQTINWKLSKKGKNEQTKLNIIKQGKEHKPQQRETNKKRRITQNENGNNQKKERTQANTWI